MVELKAVVILLNCYVLINSAVLNQNIFSRRLLQLPTTCPKIAQRETKQVVEYSLCPSKTTYNDDSSRIPKRIEEVVCIEDSEKCNDCYNKQYQCVQLLTTTEVYYMKSGKANEIIPNSETLTYMSGCVCAKLPVNKAGEIKPSFVN